MHFGDIRALLYFGWLIPAVIFFYIVSGKARRKAMEAFGGNSVLDRITVFYSRRVRRWSVVLIVTAFSLMVLALAHPQWGYYWKENKKKGIDIIFGIDTSKSMLARDATPNRLEFVKSEVEAFAKKLKGDRVGIIAFSGSSFLQCPLTSDYKGFILALNSLGTTTIYRAGTAISSAIREAVRCYRGAEASHKIFILISDGEHHEGDIDKAIELALKEKIQIYCIGVGTPAGATLYENDKDGKSVPVKDEYGKPVVTRLNEATLQKIALATGGLYKRAYDADFGLEGLYEERLSKLEKREQEGDKIKVYQEKFQYPVALACLILIAEMILREKRRDEEV